LDDFVGGGGFPFSKHYFTGGAEAVAKEEGLDVPRGEFESDAIETHASTSGLFDVAREYGGVGRLGSVGRRRAIEGNCVVVAWVLGIFETKLDLAEGHLRDGFFDTAEEGAVGIGEGREEALGEDDGDGANGKERNGF